jgi:hypothetical protein
MEEGAKLIGALNQNGGRFVLGQAAPPIQLNSFATGPANKGQRKSAAHPLSAAPAGTLIQGDLVVGLGTIEMDLGEPMTASQAPVLTVTGAATLGGTLSVQFTNGFAPAKGETFDLFKFQSSVAGQFAKIQIGGLAPGFLYDFKPGASGTYTLTALNDGIATSPPLLTVTRMNNQLQISWPASAPGFTLQQKTNLSSAAWVTVPSSGNNVVVPLTNTQEFFRLEKP